jgi:hypothetical protein
MTKATFWKPNNKINSLNNQEPVLNMNQKKKKKFSKKFGIGGGIFLAIVFVFVAVGFIFIVRPGLAMMGSINALRSDTAALQKALISRNVPDMSAALDKTEADLNEFKKARDSNFGWVKNFGPLKDYYSDSEHFIAAGKYLIEASRDAVQLIMPFADAADSK